MGRCSRAWFEEGACVPGCILDLVHDEYRLPPDLYASTASTKAAVPSRPICCLWRRCGERRMSFSVCSDFHSSLRRTAFRSSHWFRSNGAYILTEGYARDAMDGPVRVEEEESNGEKSNKHARKLVPRELTYEKIAHLKRSSTGSFRETALRTPPSLPPAFFFKKHRSKSHPSYKHHPEAMLPLLLV